MISAFKLFRRLLSGDRPQRAEQLDGAAQQPGVNVIKHFSFIADNEADKLECLYLAITFQSSLTFAGNTRSLPKKEPSERCSNWVGPGIALKF